MTRILEAVFHVLPVHRSIAWLRLKECIMIDSLNGECDVKSSNGFWCYGEIHHVRLDAREP
jgi:hypothetical protein